MTFAVHISLGEGPGSIRSYFNYLLFTTLAKRRPDDHVVFIFDKPFDPALITAENITPVLLGPPVKNKLLQHYWYQYKLPKVLAKYQADAYVNQDKSVCLSSATKQYMVVEDLAFLQKNTAYSRSDMRYYKKYFHRFIQKAASVIVTNESLIKILEEKYPGCNEKLMVVKPGPMQVLNVIKDNNAAGTTAHDGPAYFVFLATTSSEAHSQTVLKAFSIFKKWQQSSMKLVIVSTRTEKDFSISNLSTYKYRNDVSIICGGLQQDSIRLIRNAYAAIYLPSDDIFEPEAAMMLQFKVPLICSDTSFFRAQFAGAAMYTENKEQSLSEKMMRLYKDETLRNEICKFSSDASASDTWEKLAEQLADSLQPHKGLTFAVH